MKWCWTMKDYKYISIIFYRIRFYFTNPATSHISLVIGFRHFAAVDDDNNCIKIHITLQTKQKFRYVDTQQTSTCIKWTWKFFERHFPLWWIRAWNTEYTKLFHFTLTETRTTNQQWVRKIFESKTTADGELGSWNFLGVCAWILYLVSFQSLSKGKLKVIHDSR